MTTILIVHDKPNVRYLFHEEMQDEGYNIISVRNNIKFLVG